MSDFLSKELLCETFENYKYQKLSTEKNKHYTTQNLK